MKTKKRQQAPYLNDPELIFDRYYNLSLRFLSYRPRSEQEVHEYLKRKTKNLKLEEEEKQKIIAKIMQRLLEYKFIDDNAFARFWI
jgi:SOS response regulatory protein OraA/RecX